MVDKKYLLCALKDLGLPVEEGDLEVRGFAGQNVKVDIRVPLRMSYDIGFRKVDGRYEIVADWFGVRGVKKNELPGQLMQRYAYHAALDKLEEQGFSLVEEENQQEGRIHLVLRRVV